MSEISLPLPAAPLWPRIDKGVVYVAGGALVLGALLLSQSFGPRQGLLLVIGGLLGATLYHAAFGFTGGWRRLVVERRGRAMRAQMLMVGLAALAFIPLLALGSVGERTLVGATAPVGVSVALGAAL